MTISSKAAFSTTSTTTRRDSVRSYPVETLAPMKDGAKADTAESIDNRTSVVFMVLCNRCVVFQTMMRNTILSSFDFAIVLILIRQEPCHLSVDGDTWKMEKLFSKIQKKRFRRGRNFWFDKRSYLKYVLTSLNPSTSKITAASTCI